jgi:hypothetical protein
MTAEKTEQSRELNSPAPKGEGGGEVERSVAENNSTLKSNY